MPDANAHVSAFPPPAAATAEQLAFLRATDSPTIANAVETLSLRDRCDGHIGGDVRDFAPDLGVMVGHALTVRMTSVPGPVAGRDGYWRMWEMLEQVPRPSVLVIQDISGEPGRCAYFGEAMTTMALRLGAVGLVTDGGVRDLEEVHALGFHYFARYAVVSHGNFSIADAGEPISLAGQVVRTGDLLHGDRNGVVIIPTGAVGGLAEAVATIRRREKEFMEFIRSESFSLAATKARSGY
ncbi:MAG: RraA family protein [Chloroflexia bacterium]|nr:RraA family protein [Chloroflexia bacterium]